jgi:hypothetical protein
MRSFKQETDMADTSVEDAVQAGTEAVKHESGTMMRVWQHNATRMLRANERLMHGIMSAAKLQIELGQEVLQHRLDRMQAGAPESAGHSMIEQQTKEMERLMAAMREISEEMRISFAEAAKLLFEDIEEDAKALRDSSAATVAQAQEIVRTATAKAPKKTEAAVETFAESESD